MLSVVVGPPSAARHTQEGLQDGQKRVAGSVVWHRHAAHSVLHAVWQVRGGSGHTSTPRAASHLAKRPCYGNLESTQSSTHQQIHSSLVLEQHLDYAHVPAISCQVQGRLSIRVLPFLAPVSAPSPTTSCQQGSPAL